ncbi:MULTISPECIES: hypothetical protein [Hymenobacter]|uniref:Uncharacterized protein n=1 Tax=Hymenobacter jejuensis TaxID=2502781 RepID=A0A5B7ZY07_9BACT|nr:MULTISPECIES: hypothetical protein [Hymenobacter]MBC6991499.1 hypothetical protein [Hymenobacter sp. BT491]QDA59830.1 hypothetical protein FHG12_06785 [Hymenobacter jejuensis]
MAKLFLFGIGGTGSRVIRSLTMLLASGIKLRNCDRVVPIIIDPDAHNGDMNRTVNMLKSYQQIYSHLGPREEGFFETDVSTLSSISADTNGGVKDTFVFDFGGINQSFRQYLHYDQLSVDSKGLVELLFTQDNLESPLTIGFRGSPNVGSVVLNKVVESPEIRFFADNFQEGDRIFFISSIFGGTGAAGFPLLLKNLKDQNTRLSNARYLRDAITGAVTVMPYFALQSEDNSVIDSNSFLTKTKAALSYYEHNLQGLNALYYLADTPDTPYENQPGGTAQRNKAHVIELLAALSIVDFMQYPDAELRGSGTQFHEYGLGTDAQEIQFSHLPDESREIVAKHLTQLLYFTRYHKQHLATDKAPYHDNLNLDYAMRNEPIFRELSNFLHSPEFGVDEWLKELSQNRRAFRPFDLTTDDFNVMIAGKPVEKKWNDFFNKGLSHNYLLDSLNKAEKTIAEPDSFRKMLALFYDVTDKAFEEKVKVV